MYDKISWFEFFCFLPQDNEGDFEEEQEEVWIKQKQKISVLQRIIS